MRRHKSCGDHVPHDARPVHLPDTCGLCAHWDHASVAEAIKVIVDKPNLKKKLTGTGECIKRAPHYGKNDISNGHIFPRTPSMFWCGDGKKKSLLDDAQRANARMTALLTEDVETEAKLASPRPTPAGIPQKG